MTNKEQFEKDGFVLLKSLLSQEEVTYYKNVLSEKSGINDDNFHLIEGNKKKKLNGVVNYKLFTGPDGVTKTPGLWSIFFHEKILAKVREVLGEEIRFVQHNDTHVGFSASSWHRDSAFRDYGVGPDWDESKSRYQNVRVAIYLQSYEQSNFKLGFVLNSHQKQSGLLSLELKLNQIVKFKSLIFGQKMLFNRDEWLRTDPGDIIIFDPRLLHRGSYITGPKYSMFIAYGIENEHYKNYNDYYLKTRQDLNYSIMPKELADQLRKADLYPENYQFSVE